MSLIEEALKKLRGSTAGSPQVAAALARAVPAQAPAPIRRSTRQIQIDRAALRGAGLLCPQKQERRLAAEYRQIKRPLVSAAFVSPESEAEHSRLIMIASALPGDGKTFTTLNLALSIALEKDVTVLLVDGDLAKPHLSNTFGVDGEPGLLEALVDEQADVESFIMSTDVQGLSVLPSGHARESATELLASARMAHVVARLLSADPSRVVVFDSSPLLLTTDSRVLANSVGQVLIVVRAGGTPRSAITEAIAALPESKRVGLVLNQFAGSSAANYYGYGSYGTEPDSAGR